MVQHHFNHPSIIIWGILNECASYEREGWPIYERQITQIKKMDNSRPLTFALLNAEGDHCFHLADIVSYNRYPGWYSDLTPEEDYIIFRKNIDSKGGKGKPLIISEFGAAAIYGYRDPARVKWSEERQADIIEADLKEYMNRPDICGVFVWQFCDCRITEEGRYVLTRARCKNNKGIVDEYRRPKLSYSVIKKYYKNK